MTDGVRVTTAGPEDRAAVERLLTENDLPLEGLNRHWDNFLVARTGQDVVGAIGVERYGSTGLLRSLVVSERGRGQGIGRALVEALFDQCAEQGIGRLYLLTTTAERYFPRFGFEEIARDEVEPAVTASAEFRGACPASAIVMRVDLA